MAPTYRTYLGSELLRQSKYGNRATRCCVRIFPDNIHDQAPGTTGNSNILFTTNFVCNRLSPNGRSSLEPPQDRAGRVIQGKSESLLVARKYESPRLWRVPHPPLATRPYSATSLRRWWGLWP